MINNLPSLQKGDSDMPGFVYYVHRAQALIQVIGKINNIDAARNLVVDGDFGPASVAALKAVQHYFGIEETGVCGPLTWELLVTGWRRPQ